MDELTITIPLPGKQCSPNVRCHWHATSRAKKVLREATAWAAHGEILRLFHVEPKWKSATIQATFFHKDKRRRDPDNLLASLKAAFDGLTDAGLIADDDRLTHLPVLREVDKTDPRVELRITKGES